MRYIFKITFYDRRRIMAKPKPVKPSYADFATWKQIIKTVFVTVTPEQKKKAEERAERCKKLYADD